MTDAERQSLVDQYVAYLNAPKSEEPPEPPEAVDDCIYAGGPDALALVRALVTVTPEDKLSTVAAGPLEEFVRRHAAAQLDALLAAMRHDDKFRRAMAGVWGLHRLAERIRAPIQALLQPPAPPQA